jgi:hypothetical protein
LRALTFFASQNIAGEVLCRGMLEKEQRKFRTEYEARFRELERERVAIQDDKAKVQLCPVMQLTVKS